MTSLKEMQWSSEPSTMSRASRLLAAALLRSAGAMLSRFAASLTSESVVTRSDPRFEFHAEAGAPEGALYVDGHLVGWLSGVRRL
jgi:hypothetical protein